MRVPRIEVKPRRLSELLNQLSAHAAGVERGRAAITAISVTATRRAESARITLLLLNIASRDLRNAERAFLLCAARVLPELRKETDACRKRPLRQHR